MHLNVSLTRNIEIGAQSEDDQQSLEVTTTDGGKEVRNLRSDDEPRQWNISLPLVDTENGDATDYDALRQLWADSDRGLHTFNFHCFVDDADFIVRFASPLRITAPAGFLRHVDDMTIREVLGTVPLASVSPSISGTQTVGSTLTVSNGTWSGSPTFTYQWLRDGVEIASATNSTYVLAAEDSGAMIGAYVFASEDNETTRAEATAVGPIA